MKLPVAFLYGLGLLGLDVSSKNWAQQHLQRQDIEVIPNFFKLSLVRNYGIAFGLFDDSKGASRLQLALLVLVAVVALIVVVAYVLRSPPGASVTQWGLGFLMGGILGNMTDRLLHAGVVDFLEFNLYWFKFPTFNVADTGITLGVALLLLESFAEREVLRESGAGGGVTSGDRPT
jgi:signal peptidase II